MKILMTAVLLAAGFSPAFSGQQGSFAELAGAADSGAVNIASPAPTRVNVGAAFPGMQTCSFTAVKDNTCVFTCKNGATVTRPVLQSSLVANGCAKFVMIPAARNKAAQSWADAAKAAYLAAIDEGGLTAYADLKELPPGARRQLEQEWQTLPEGPGNESEPFKMMVNGRTAFVIQSYIHDDAMRAYIFNAAGVLVAYGEGSIEKDFAWLPLPR